MDLEEDTTTTTLETDSIEYQLKHIKEYGNEKQLDLLRLEIDHIMAHGIKPSEGWYDERFEYIDTYSNLDWGSLMKQFPEKEHYIYNTALYIIRNLDDLVEEYSTTPNFNLNKYYNLINNIHDVWHNIKDKLPSEEGEDDMMDLVNGLNSLSIFLK